MVLVPATGVVAVSTFHPAVSVAQPEECHASCGLSAQVLAMLQSGLAAGSCMRDIVSGTVETTTYAEFSCKSKQTFVVNVNWYCRNHNDNRICVDLLVSGVSG